MRLPPLPLLTCGIWFSLDSKQLAKLARRWTLRFQAANIVSRFHVPRTPTRMAVSTDVCQDLAKLFEAYRSALRDWTEARADFSDDSTEVRLATRYVEQLEAALSRHKQEHGC